MVFSNKENTSLTDHASAEQGAVNASLTKNHQEYGDKFFIDEVCVNIDAKPHYLLRTLDKIGEVVEEIPAKTHRFLGICDFTYWKVDTAQ